VGFGSQEYEDSRNSADGVHSDLEKASYRVRFIVDAWTISNALVSVEMSYPERGGKTHEWAFENKTGTWVRVKDESKGWWD
jgi:hypothetical protein